MISFWKQLLTWKKLETLLPSLVMHLTHPCPLVHKAGLWLKAYYLFVLLTVIQHWLSAPSTGTGRRRGKGAEPFGHSRDVLENELSTETPSPLSNLIFYECKQKWVYIFRLIKHSTQVLYYLIYSYFGWGKILLSKEPWRKGSSDRFRWYMPARIPYISILWDMEKSSSVFQLFVQSDLYLKGIQTLFGAY